MSKQYTPRKFYNFVLVDRSVSNTSEYAFQSYTDISGAYTNSPGSVAMYVISKGPTGQDKGKYFNLNQSHSNFRVTKEEKDIYGRSQYDFIACSPECLGSPNGFYQGEGDDRIQIGVRFKLMDTDGDALLALETGKRRAQAESSALEVDNDTLKDLAAHIGLFGEPGDLMRMQVFQWAGKRPADYFEVLNSGDRAVRAIVRKALESGIFKKKGEIILWDSTVIGSNEDNAVAKLLTDKVMVDALETKMSMSNKAVIKSKPGPKPIAK